MSCCLHGELLSLCLETIDDWLYISRHALHAVWQIVCCLPYRESYASGRQTMKKAMVIAGFLLGVFGLSVPIYAAQQVAGHETNQKITKKARIVAAYASVHYSGAPRFVPIAETSISYGTNTPQEVIKIGDVFYLYMQDVWLTSANAEGPWMAAQHVPEAVNAIICNQLNFDPYDPYQLCSLSWQSGLSYTVWKPSQPSANSNHP
jgi:hypothetical protein